jgi:AraC-like DNA-binding protein
MADEEYPKVYLYKRIVQAKLYIDSHFAEALDLDNISDEANFSKFHFIRIFRKVYGKTPYQYLTIVRIENAMQLLKLNKSVTETCFEVGFESMSSFSGLFKRLVGISPSAYFNQQQHIKAHIAKAPLDFIPGCFAESKGWKKNSNFEEAPVSVQD